jgi:hypothetical protein
MQHTHHNTATFDSTPPLLTCCLLVVIEQVDLLFIG